MIMMTDEDGDDCGDGEDAGDCDDDGCGDDGRDVDGC